MSIKKATRNICVLISVIIVPLVLSGAAFSQAAEGGFAAHLEVGAEISRLVSNPKVQAAFKFIEGEQERNNQDLITLTEIPAPPFGEEKRGKAFADMLRSAGISDISIDEVGNVIGRRPGKLGGKTIAFGAHLDTVFPIDTDVKVQVDGVRFRAPGIGDNTRGLVLLLSLVRALNDAAIETNDDVLFIGTVGEEGLGDLRGVKHLFREDGPKIDIFIGIDGGAANRLIYGGVGSHRYRVTVKGPGGHSWGAFGMANPHHALARIIAAFDEAAPAVTSQGPKTSYNIGRIGGGTSINSIPFESWMEVDMRSGVQSKLDEIDAVFKAAVEKGLSEENEGRLEGPALTVVVEPVGKRPAGLGDKNGSLVQNAYAAMKAKGLKPQLRISSTDSNIPISLGIPAVTLSRGGHSLHAHSLKEEWIDHESHVAIQIALLTLLAEGGLAK